MISDEDAKKFGEIDLTQVSTTRNKKMTEQTLADVAVKVEVKPQDVQTFIDQLKKDGELVIQTEADLGTVKEDKLPL